jgi:hypothetical protein
MAKRQARRQTRQAPAPENLTVKALYEKLSGGLKRQIESMRDQFGEYGAAFRAAWTKREELCEPFFRLFGAVQAEQSCTFVQFVGLMDPTVPVDQRDDDPRTGTKGYRSHPSYNAALYMQRLQQQRNRERQREEAGDQTNRPRALNARERLARVLASMVQVIRDGEIERFWSGIGEELDLDTQSLARLRKDTESAEPIIRIPENMRPASKLPVRIIHMVRPGEHGEGDEQEARRNVRRNRAA